MSQLGTPNNSVTPGSVGQCDSQVCSQIGPSLSWASKKGLKIVKDSAVKNTDCPPFKEEIFLDEEGWKDEARGVIKDIADYVKVT